jgi:hypothetical protein
MMRLTNGLPGFLLPTTLHHVCGAVACFPIRLSRLHLIFSVSANSIRRIVTVAVSNRLNPIVGRIRWEKNRLADITSRRLLKRKKKITDAPLFIPCANKVHPLATDLDAGLTDAPGVTHRRPSLPTH